MLSTLQLLDRARARQGGVSDYRLAQLLGVPRATVSSYRVGGSKPANPIAARLAALAELDPLEVVCAVNIERASNEEEREIWRSLLTKVERAEHASKAAQTAPERQIVAGEKSARHATKQALSRAGTKVKPVHNRAR